MTATDHDPTQLPPPPPPPPPPAPETPRISTPLLTTATTTPAPKVRRRFPWKVTAIATGTFLVGTALGATAQLEPEVLTETVTRTETVEAELSAAEEQALRDEGAADAAADLDSQREALLEQGRQEGRNALAAEQSAAAAQAQADAEAAEVRVGPGTLVVGTDIEPGLYRIEAGTDILDSVYWARLSSLSGDFGSIIANDNVTGVATVEVKASDVAFETDGVWSKVG